MDIRSISISDYTYTLPDEKIARYPLPERDSAKLLVYRNRHITEDRFRNIAACLPAHSLLVFNNTRVVAARLLFQKQSGGTIEVFCLEPGDPCTDTGTGMQQQGHVQWKCLIGGASKWKKGQSLQKTIQVGEIRVVLEAFYTEKQKDCFIIDLHWTPAQLSFAAILEAAGEMPLPPYLKRSAERSDKERYQTLYAQNDGSVAAPTAGLHFTPQVFEQLQQQHILPAYVTLHVGAGTFKPVSSDTMDGHHMHAEFIDVSKETLETLMHFSGQVIAVGTTAARTLESLYWMGLKTHLHPDLSPQELALTQWEVYDQWQAHQLTAEAALNSLLRWMEKQKLARLITKTQLLIAPGYPFKIIEGLVTNFHQPRSTLLLLVAAITGGNWQNIYTYALDHQFRFLSYGDACLIMKS